MMAVLLPLVLLVFAAVGAVAQESPNAVKTCTVAGRVVRADSGEPLKSAHVVLREFEKRDQWHSYHTATDADGMFVIQDVLPGHYRFSATRNGYVQREFKAKGRGSEGAILTLTSGQELSDAVFRLVRAAAVIGHVTDEDGEPVVGVEVEALVKGTSDDEEDESEYTPARQVELAPVSVGVTNDLGEFRLYGLPPGEYYFSAVDSGDPQLSDYNIRRGSYGYTLGQEPRTNHPPMYYPGVLTVRRWEKLVAVIAEILRRKCRST